MKRKTPKELKMRNIVSFLLTSLILFVSFFIPSAFSADDEYRIREIGNEIPSGSGRRSRVVGSGEIEGGSRRGRSEIGSGRRRSVGRRSVGRRSAAAEEECGHVRVDIVFVLDTSNSVGYEDFDHGLDFVVEFVEFLQEESIPFSETDARLAVIQFGSKVRTDLTFDQSTSGSVAALKDRIKGIKRMEGLETNTAEALKTATKYFETNERKNARKHTIVVTDGQCTHTYLSELYTNAAALRGGGSEGREERQVWSIGVGDADKKELENISGNVNRVVSIENYARIAEIKQFFREKIHRDLVCPELPTGCKKLNGGCQQYCVQQDGNKHYCACQDGFKLDEDLHHCNKATPPPLPPTMPTTECGHVRVDVVFVLDSSNSIGYSDFDHGLNFVVEFVDFLQEESIPFSETDARLAVIQFGSKVRTDLTFDQSTSGDVAALKGRIKGIKRMEGLETNTAKALKMATKYFERNERKNARKHTIVVTDGQCTHTYLSKLYANAAALRGGGSGGREERQVWSIGVGEADKTELENISGNVTRVVSIENYARIDEIKQFFRDKIHGDLVCPEKPPGCETLNGECQQDCVQPDENKHHCACRDGFELDEDGRHCNEATPPPPPPIDLCSMNNGGCDHLCRLSPDGSRVFCSCHEGFQLAADSFSCIFVDECRTDNGDCQHLCRHEVTEKHRRCYCQPGFELSLDGTSCHPTCAADNGGCQHDCRMTEGRAGGGGRTEEWTDRRVVCECRSGFVLSSDGKTCKRILHLCEDNNGGCQQLCYDYLVTPDTHCACEEGYRLDDDLRTCKFVNLCRENNGGCHQICRHDEGAPPRRPVCSCKEGFKTASDGETCEIVDECQSRNGDCQHICIFDGSGVPTHYCKCNRGFELSADGRSCVVVDNCESNNGGCDHVCDRVPGSIAVICTCREGFALDDDDGTSCKRKDPCKSFGCAHTCASDRVVAGNPRCFCYDGYRLEADGKSCENIECSANNGGCQQICHAYIGTLGTHCACRHDYRLNDDGKTCRYADGCVGGDNGGCQHDCHQEPGSLLTHCTCRSGFSLKSDGKSCGDLDECLLANGGCSHRCHNALGSFHCYCNSGFRLQPDHKTCVDEDECGEGEAPNGGCQHSCVNTQGSFYCTCKTGYTLAANGLECAGLTIGGMNSVKFSIILFIILYVLLLLILFLCCKRYKKMKATKPPPTTPPPPPIVLIPPPPPGSDDNQQKQEPQPGLVGLLQSPAQQPQPGLVGLLQSPAQQTLNVSTTSINSSQEVITQNGNTKIVTTLNYNFAQSSTAELPSNAESRPEKR